MPKHPFEMVPLPVERSTEKPRSTGLTMMIDFGIPLGRLEDLFGLVAPYVDLVKIAVGTSRLYRETYLDAKLRLAEGFGVKPFVGGQFLEYVVATQGLGAAAAYFAEAKRLGFAAIEVSDNCVPLSAEERRRLVAEAVEAGLEVHGEVGSKEVKQAPAELVAQARDCFEAGAHVVLVEAAELVEGGAVKRDLVDAIRGELDVRRVLFELPGPWIKGTTLADVYALKTFLVREFGPDVNIANVMPDDVFETEALRVGLSVVGPERVKSAAE